EAPPGGCKHRSRNINPMAAPTAIAAVAALVPPNCTQTMPTRAEREFPPMTDHGCASGLEGAPNTRTALAPIGATNHGHRVGDVGSIAEWHNHPAARMPNAPPTATRTR